MAKRGTKAWRLAISKGRKGKRPYRKDLAAWRAAISAGKLKGREKRPRSRDRYMQHRRDARYRGIEFLLTYEQWMDIWERSGHFHESGTKLGQYCMARFGDAGPYSVDNVRIIQACENVREIVRAPQTLLHRARISAANKGKERTLEFRENLRRLAFSRPRGEQGQFK